MFGLIKIAFVRALLPSISCHTALTTIPHGKRLEKADTYANYSTASTSILDRFL